MLNNISLTSGRGNLALYTDGTDLLIYETINNAGFNAIQWNVIADNDDIYIQGTYTVQ